jgi:putative acetyltransferase
MASIRSIGAKTYSPEIVYDWGAPRTGELYVRSMEDGTRFFVATGVDHHKIERIIGFSAYVFENGKYRIAVYVVGDFARCGVGTALFTAAEGAARMNGAEQIDIDASLGAVPFYKAIGFEERGTGDHKLKGGRTMACVFMRKRL